MCGAVSGGLAALGLAYGRRYPTEKRQDQAGAIAREFLSQFKSQFGSEHCGILIGDTLRKNSYEAEERRKRCRAYTLYAVKTCMDLLAKYEKTAVKE
jgi:C_GCAxxG_C_C family probable redox protein